MTYDVISCHIIFQFAYYVELWMDYQLAKFQFCRLPLASFIDRFRKTQWWRHHDIIICCWDLTISNFLKLYIDYHLSKCQIPWLSGSNYMEVSIRHQILPLFFVMTPLWGHLLLLSFQICIFVEHNISYQPCKFQLSRMCGSNFTEGWDPSAFRVKCSHFCGGQ